MSYILDALRKSDQQRRRGAPPSLLAPQASAGEPRRRLSASHIVLTAVLVGAGIVIGSLRPWQTEQPAIASRPATNPLEPSPRASALPVQPQTVRKTEEDGPAPRIASPIPSAAVLGAGAMDQQAPAAGKPQFESRTLNTPRQTMPAAPQAPVKAVPENFRGGGAAAQQQKVITMAELPLSIRQEMPTLSISVHAYSREPKDRLLGISDRVVREGEDLAPGLRLEEITRDGMILRYKGYRFLRGAR